MNHNQRRLALLVPALGMAAYVAIPLSSFVEPRVALPLVPTAPAFTVDLIPGLSFGSSLASGNNDLGQVVGTVTHTPPGGSALQQGFIWTPGSDAGLLEVPAGATNAPAVDINDAGTTGGFASVPVGPFRPVRWSAAGVADMITIPPTSGFVAQITSLSETGYLISSRHLISPANTLVALTVPGCSSCTSTINAFDVNSAGQVTGSARVTTTITPPRAALWDASGNVVDLGVDPAFSSFSRGLSESGHVVGSMAHSDGLNHGFFWTPQLGLTDLGASPFADGCTGLQGMDVSEYDEVAGFSNFGPAGCKRVPFYWTQATGFVRLPMPAGYETWSVVVRRINNHGQIVGQIEETANSSNRVAVVWQLAAENLLNTPTGAGVAVQPVDALSGTSPVTLTFTGVTAGGQTSLEISTAGPPVPAGFSLGDPPAFYEITTTAVAVQPITVCINYGGVSYTDESQLHLLHFEGGEWVDRTTSLDTNGNVICGSVSSLSPFVVAEKAAGSLLSAATPASVWLGLKNSDDVGTKFDLLAEVLKNDVVVGTGQVNNVPGGSSGFNNAVLQSINVALPAEVALLSGDVLSLRVSVRIAATGHRSGTARLWYNDAGANSRLGVTITGGNNAFAGEYYLAGSGASNLVLSAGVPGAGPRRSIDVFADRAVAGNPFKPFGTWTVVVP